MIVKPVQIIMLFKNYIVTNIIYYSRLVTGFEVYNPLDIELVSESYIPLHKISVIARIK